MKTKYLFITLIAIIGIYLLVDIFRNNETSDSFRTSLVSFDTSSVTRILIESAIDTVDLNGSGDEWQLKLTSTKEVPVLKNNVTSTLASLLTIKPTRIISKDPTNTNYQVSEAVGTRVQVFEGSKKVVDIILGTIGTIKSDQPQTNPYQQRQQRFFSYVRLPKENNVYVCEDFLSFNITKEGKNYRNSQLLGINKDSLESITFVYADNSGFTLDKFDSVWFIKNEQQNSDSVTQFLNNITYLISDNFEDDWNPEGQKPLHTIIFKQKNAVDQEIRVFLKDTNFIFHSSINELSYFIDSNNLLSRQLLVPKTIFF